MATINNGLYSVDTLVLVLNDRRITSFIDGDIIEFAPVSDKDTMIFSTDGGTNFIRRIEGEAYTLTMNIQRGSQDDAFLARNQFSKTLTFYNGSCKILFERDGQDVVETWTLSGGILTTQPTQPLNTDQGNQTQPYMIKFRTATRRL